MMFAMRQGRGMVWIGPAAHVPRGRLADPSTTRFIVSWQGWDETTQRTEEIEDGGEMVGAEAAVAWATARADRVLIRLAHTKESYFSAGVEPAFLDDRELPPWPPLAPEEGWYVPADDEHGTPIDEAPRGGTPTRGELGVSRPSIHRRE
jgi:hypothetical protein